MRILFLILLTFFITGCTKKLTVKSLQTSQITNENIKNIHLKRFLDDRINQTEYLEEELTQKKLNNEKLFFLKSDYENIDAIITGKVLESSSSFSIYYKEDLNEYHCRLYDKKKKKCIEYIKVRYPCENRRYKVRTNLKVLDSHENSLFSKVYTKTTQEEVCFKNKLFPYLDLSIYRNENRIHAKLAEEIAKDMIKDLAPYYYSENIKIIDSLENQKPLYTKKIQEEFEAIVKLIEDDSLNLAQNRLIKLDKFLEGKSYEVTYNLALIYETKEVLHTAKSLYEDSLKEAKRNSLKEENILLIQNAVNRINKNINNKYRYFH